MVTELERGRDCVLVVAHQAVLRALYGYFTDMPLAVRLNTPLASLPFSQDGQAGKAGFLHVCMPLDWPTMQGMFPLRFQKALPSSLARTQELFLKRHLLQEIPSVEVPLHTLIELTPQPDGKMSEQHISFDLKNQRHREVSSLAGCQAGC